MRKFLTYITLFIFILCVPLFFLSRLDNRDRNTSGDSNIQKILHANEFDSLDYLFIGNSYTYSGVDVSLFDSLHKRTFNLGIATAGPFFYELVLNDYLSRIERSPKYVFVLLSPTTFSSYADNFSSYPIHRYLDRPFSNEQISLKYQLFHEYFSIQKHSLLKAVKYIAKGTDGSGKEGAEKQFRNGFVPSSEVNTLEKESKSANFYVPLKNESFDEKKFSYLLDYCSRLERKGIRVVYYELADNHLRSYFNSEFLRSYSLHISDLKSTHLFLNSFREFENKYFRNPDHLNSAGADEATKVVIGEMQRMGMISGNEPDDNENNIVPGNAGNGS